MRPEHSPGITPGVDTGITLAVSAGWFATLVRRGGILFLSNSIGQALAFFTSIATGRVLGVQGFGQYSVVMALVFVLGMFAEAGIETALTREVARDPSMSRHLLSGSLLAKCVLGGLLAVVLAMPPVARALAPDKASVPAVQLAGLLIVLNACNASFSAVFRAWGQMGYVLLVNVSGMSLQLAGAVPVVLAFHSVQALIAWLVCVQVYELGAGWLLFRRGERAVHSRPYQHVRPLQPRFWRGLRGPGVAAPVAVALLRQSWPFALAGLLGALTIRADLFLIELLRGTYEAGIYGVATRLSDLLALAPGSFFAALLPALAAVHAGGGSAAAGGAYRVVVRRMALAGAAAALIGLAIADFVVVLSFGAAYRQAAMPLRMLALVLVPLLVNRTTVVYLYATRREGLANTALALGLAVRLAAGVALVNVWGAPGAALADLVAECCVFIFYQWAGVMKGSAAGRTSTGEAYAASAEPR